jgi:hypothetical protein
VKRTPAVLLTAFLVFSAIAAIISNLQPMPYIAPTPKPPDYSDALARNCVTNITARLAAPSTAKIDRQFLDRVGLNHYQAAYKVDSQNYFGAMIRTNFWCSMDCKGDQCKLDLKTF